MEFLINKDYFYKAIQDVSKVVSSKTTLPILTGIKIIAERDSLLLIGSNSEIIIERVLPEICEGVRMVEVIKTGSIVVSAKYLSEISKRLPDEIHFKVSHDQSVTIQADEIKTRLNGFSGDEYPSLPDIPLNHNFRIKSESLIEIIKQTVFATSKNETRPVLTGVNFYFEENSLTCVATNSHRLAMKKYSVASKLIGSFTVPGSSLIELTKLFGSNPTEIEIYANDHIILFKSLNLSFYSRLIDGVYPKVSGLIPEDKGTFITLNTLELLKGIDRASLFASEWKNNNITFRISDESKVTISSKSSEMGQIEETQYIKNRSGDLELTITLDGNFMMDALKAIKENEVTLCFNGTMKPILILPVGNDSQIQLISPVRSY